MFVCRRPTNYRAEHNQPATFRIAHPPPPCNPPRPHAALPQRYALLPYLYTALYDVHTGRAGTVARPLAWEFPSDPRVADLSTQVRASWVLGVLGGPGGP